MEIDVNDSMTTEEMLDKSLRLLKNVFDSEQPRFRQSPGNSMQQGKSFSKSRMDDVFQSTKMKLGPDSPSNFSDVDISFTLTPSELRKFSESKSFQTGKFVNPVAKSAQDRLFTDFLESWQAAGSSEQDVFGCILEYIQFLTDASAVIRGSDDHTLARLSPMDAKRLVEIESEKNTWKLIYSLYQDRVLAPPVDDEDMTELCFENVSEQDIMERLFRRDSTVREWQLVLDWLEGNALETATGGGVLENYTDKAVAWENTLLELQSRNSVPYRSTREFISELDPDAPRRQGKHLHDMDQDDEDRLTQLVLKEIRCGRLEEAQALCVHAGQPWRAAVLEGWKLYHDPNYTAPPNQVNRELMPVKGNANRDIWKVCAWRMCDDGQMPAKARAAVGAFCGHLQSLLGVSSSWEDFLWSYLKTLVDIRVEREIRTCSLKTYVDMPPAYWNNEMTIDAVFSEMAANHSRGKVAPDHVIQRAVITDSLPKLADDISKWISGSDMSVGGDSEAVSPHFLRFLAHFVLFLRQIGRPGVEVIGDSVIEAYVKLLMDRRETQLVAWYVSQLNHDDQVYFYSLFLEEISDSGQREEAVRAALQAGLNVDLITKTVVENIRQQPCNVDNVGLAVQEVSQEDELKISALEWLTFYPSQRTELVVQANALIAYFLAAGNVFAARKAFEKVPPEVIGSIQPQQLEEDNYINMALENIPKTVALATKEYLCYRAYLEADDSFTDWFQHFNHGKPVEPVLQPGYTFIEKVGHEHRYNQYKADLEKWKSTMEQQTASTKSLLFNVLLFPMGWLVDDEPDEEDRTEQLNALRSIIIPKVAFLLHLVMHSMQDYASCLALADLIASPRHCLFKVFSKQRLQDFLQKLAESSMALMNDGKDSWGFRTE